MVAVSHVFLSIIIPVYNVEKYIECCLLSCLRQNVPSNTYEIIIVDDGSPDKSIDSIFYMLNKYNNIKLLTQSNKGLSAARNKGLSVAVGQYIWFVDSDDWIEENILDLISRSLDGKVDILTFCASNVAGDIIERRFSYRNIANLKMRGVDLMCDLFLQHCVPFSIYRREFLADNNLLFFEGIFHEDTEFTPRAYYYAKEVVCLNDIFYYVRQNPMSITRTFNFKKKTDLLIVAANLYDFTAVVEEKYHKYFNNIISLALNSSLEDYYKLSAKQKKKLKDAMRDKKYLYKNMLHSNKLKYKIEGILFFMSMSFFISIHALFSRYL